MNKYLPALKLQFFILGAFFSLSVSLALTFLSHTDSLAEFFLNWGLLFFLGMALYYECYLSDCRSFWGKIVNDIFEISYNRSLYASPQEIYFKTISLILGIIILIFVTTLMWIFPLHDKSLSIAISAMSGLLGGIMFKEESMAAPKDKQTLIYYGSATFIILGGLVSVYGEQYTPTNQDAFLFVKHVAGQVCVGISVTIIATHLTGRLSRMFKVE
tara:strand:+ start:1656 stop:2300 length:645 start_codon:yes stop_codon:yes gene_type:complete